MTTLYGIKSCDTVKKAINHLDSLGIEYDFFDYKKQLPHADLIQSWVAQFGWDTVLNKRGTTYRKLDEDVKASLNADNVVEVLLANPSAIKRPVLVTKNTTLIGFKADQYQDTFK
jgi:Spx/MgsR family transcriptional regulator